MLGGSHRGCLQGVHLSQVHQHRSWSSEITSANRLLHLRQVHPLKVSSIGALETRAPPTKPPNVCKSKKFVINNIYLLVIVNHCANVYLAVWKKYFHNFAKNCVIV